MDDFHGYAVGHLNSELLDLDYLATAGPRIVGLHYKGSENLLAEVPGISHPTPYGEYHYLGGHRLWHAPEAMPRSYIPDQEGLTVSNIADGVVLDGRREPGTAIRKRLEIYLNPARPQVILTHVLTNEGLWDVQLAPWAITMLQLGGIAILPCRSDDIDLAALLPDRHLSLWPYTELSDPRLSLRDDFITVRPKARTTPLKIGTFNPRGWTAYWVANVLFRKSYGVQPGFRYPDDHCNAEIYTDGDFIELESLGPLRTISPGDSLAHVETWELYDSLGEAFLSQEMRRLITMPPE